MLSNGRARYPVSFALAAILSGVVFLAGVGAFVTVRAVVGWLT